MAKLPHQRETKEILFCPYKIPNIITTDRVQPSLDTTLKSVELNSEIIINHN
jgi:hypothetical protein